MIVNLTAKADNKRYRLVNEVDCPSVADLVLLDLSFTPSEAVEWLARQGILKNTRDCPNGCGPMHLVKHATSADGIRVKFHKLY